MIATEPTDSTRFELLERLGKGTFGAVWKARMRGRHGMNREVALKIANAGSPQLAARLRDEARILGLLRHRAIVHVQDLVPLEGEAWGLVMELVDGIDLTALLRLGALPPAFALDVMAEVADALDCAYKAVDFQGVPLRLSHRDIKPGNIMLTEDGRIKLLDFGIAVGEIADRESVTLPNEIWGSYGYMAPERQIGDESTSADLYSLGIVAYELLTSIRLGRTAPVRAVHEQRLSDAAMAMKAMRVPTDVAALILQMLSFDPCDRPTLAEVRDAARKMRPPEPILRDWAAEAVTHARRLVPQRPQTPGPPQVRERLPETSLPTPPSTMPTAPQTDRTLVAAGFGVVAIGLVAVGLAGAAWQMAAPTQILPDAPSTSSAVPSEPAISPAAAEAPVGAPSPAAVVAPTSVAPAVEDPPVPAAITAKKPVPGAASTAARADAPAPAMAIAPRLEPEPQAVVTKVPPARPTEEAEQYGTVRYSGDDEIEVWAVTGDDRIQLSGQTPLPSSSYAILVVWAKGEDEIRSGDLLVDPGKITDLTCNRDTRKCRAH